MTKNTIHRNETISIYIFIFITFNIYVTIKDGVTAAQRILIPSGLPGGVCN